MIQNLDIINVTAIPPSRNDPTNFDIRAEAFNTEIASFINSYAALNIGMQFCTLSNISPFELSLLSSGAYSGNVAGSTNGSKYVASISGTTSNTSSGAAIATEVTAISLSIDDTFNAFVSVSNANSIIRIGWQDSKTTSSPTDGTYLIISGTSAIAYCSVGGAHTTVSLGTITLGDWYFIKIKINSSGYPVFTIYNSLKVVVYQVTVSSSIIGAYYMGMGIVAYYNGTPVATTELCKIDYMAMK